MKAIACSVAPRSLELEPSMLEDAELIERLGRRDASAWREFLHRYERVIYAVPRRYGLSPEAAADVFQETLLALLRGLPRLRDARALPRWLMQTAYRLSRDRVRKDKSAGRPQAEEFWEGIADERPSQEEEMSRLESLGHLHAAIPRLSPRCRDLIRALFLEDPAPSYGELARRFQAPVGSLGPTRQRCLRTLLQLLSESAGSSKSIKRNDRNTFVARRISSRSRNWSEP
jgi:RNA polymerase sigma factor (sigma-70 family)